MSLKPRHIPERTCVVCRGKKPKSELTRIVRTPEGEVMIDPTGRMNGRGAYICVSLDDWVDGVRKGKLAHALKAPISPEAGERLLAYGRGLQGDSAQRDTGAAKQ
jgi:hypothetical protein